MHPGSETGSSDAPHDQDDRYHRIFTSMDEACAIVDVLKDDEGRWSDFRFVEVNPAFTAHTGMPHPVGRTATELLGTPNPRWTELYGRALDTGRSLRVEETESALRLIFDLNIFILDRAHNRVAVLFTDITERKRAEQAEREGKEREAFLLQLSDAIRSLGDAGEIQQTTTRLLAEHLGADRAMFAEVNGEPGTEVGFLRGQYVRPAHPGEPEIEPFPERFSYHSFGADAMARRYEGRGLAVDDIETAEGFNDAERKAWASVAVRAAVVAPLNKDGRLVAEFGVHSTRPRRWTEAEVDLIHQVAERTWAAAERARAEAALRDSEGRLARALDAGDIGVWELDLKTLEAWRSPQHDRIFGYPAMLPAWTYEIFLSHVAPEDRDAVDACFRDAVAADGRWDFECRIHRADGETSWIWAQGKVDPGTDGRPGRMKGMVRDITDRKRAEQSLRESEERQAFLLAFGDAVRAQAGADEKVAVATRLLGEKLVASRVLVAEYDHDKGLAHIFNGWLADGAAPFPSVVTLQEFEGEVLNELRAGHLVRVDDVGQRAGEPGYAAMAKAGVQALLSPPLLVDGQLKFNVSIHQHEPRHWRDDEVALVQEVTERLWAEIVRARAEEALRRSDERFRLIVANARDYAIFTLDTEGRIVDWFPGAEQVFGWTPDEACGRAFDMIFTAEDRASGAPAREKENARRDGAAADIRWHVRKDGSLIFIEGITNAIRDPDGNLRGYLKIGQDVTERRAAEQALRESEERFQQFGEASSDIIWIRNAESMAYEYVSPAFDTIYGRSRADVGDELGRWSGVIHPEDRDRVIANLNRVRAGERVTHEFRIIRPDGEMRWLDNVDFPLRDASGRIARIGGIGHDATVGKQAADALRESEERFRSFAEASEDVLWIVDAATRQLEYVSPAYERIWGEPREAIMADLGEWAKRIHPDDLPSPGEGIDALLAGRNYTAEYRVQRSDGTVRHVRDTGFPIFDQSGAVRRVAGVAQDLTERRVAERALADAEFRARTLMEGVPQLVWRSLSGGDWTWASPQWCEFTGNCGEDTVGKGWLNALHPDDRPKAMQAWAHAEENGFEVDYRVRARNGEYRWFHTRAMPVRDEAGDIIEWLGTSTDVDDMYRLQRHQRVLLAELQHRVRNTLGVVRSIVRRTAESAEGAEDMASHLQGRLAAFSRVQAALTRAADAGVNLASLVEDELLAHAARESEVLSIQGPEVTLEPRVAEALSLAVHELATNAVKYGALSAPDGRLSVRWSIEESDGRRWLDFEWRESGVTLPGTPSRRGFGIELLERSLPYEHDAVTRAEFRPTGFRFTLRMPLTAPATRH